MSEPAKDTSGFKVAALYRFCPLPHFADLREPLLSLCRAQGVHGTLLLAPEGINGTVAGRPGAISALTGWLDAEGLLDGMEIKFSDAAELPFHRMKVRLKKEIVTMGVPGTDPLSAAGAYVDAQAWNDLIADPDTVVIDTRNAYETAIGTFERAIDPKTETFREFPDWVRENKALLEGKRVAMFCTGGIRCEKATAFVRSLGIDDVYHLKGGILRYLEDVPQDQSLWNGECFVFDERVSVGHGLKQGKASLCRACRHPLTPQERESPLHEEGVSCVHCHGNRDDKALRRYAERHKQVLLAEQRGDTHIGDKVGKAG